jgi:opacity protein-like surface antigen
MLLKLSPRLIVAVLFLCAAHSALAQTVPAATEGRSPLAVGAGVAGYNPDFEHGDLLGGAIWIDYSPERVPQMLHGIGLEVEARDISLNRSSTQPNLEEDTVEGGVFYSWHHYRFIRPYAKLMMGYGNTDDELVIGVRHHDSRTVTIVGGGMEFPTIRAVWVRVDYEYQFWPDFYKNDNPAGYLTPQGFTVGAMYHFGTRHSY